MPGIRPNEIKFSKILTIDLSLWYKNNACNDRSYRIMRLSMSMLAWYLNDEHILASISDDEPTMKGIRFMTENGEKPTRDYAFIGPGRHYSTDSRYAEGSIVACGTSYLYSFDSDYERLINKVLEAFDFFAEWERRLSEASHRQAPLQELASIIAEVVENPILITGPDSSLLAWTSSRTQGLDDPYWDAAVASGTIHLHVQNDALYTTAGSTIRDFTERPVLVRNVYSDAEPVMMMNLRKDGEYLATLGIKQVDERLTNLNSQIVGIVTPLLCNAREFSEAGSLARSDADIVRDAIEGAAIHPNAAQRLLAKHIAPPFRLAAILHTTRKDPQVMAGVIRIIDAAPTPAIAANYRDCVIVLVNSRDAQALIGEIDDLDSIYRQVGISAPVSSLEMLPIAYEQAAYSLSRLGERPGAVFCEHVAHSYLLTTLWRHPECRSFMHPAIGLLKRHDTENNGELLPTLRQFVFSGRSMVRAAEKLNIHKNTLKYRMARIREVTGLDTDDAADMDYLALSLRLLALSETDGSAG